MLGVLGFSVIVGWAHVSLQIQSFTSSRKIRSQSWIEKKYTVFIQFSEVTLANVRSINTCVSTMYQCASHFYNLFLQNRVVPLDAITRCVPSSIAMSSTKCEYRRIMRLADCRCTYRVSSNRRSVMKISRYRFSRRRKLFT